MTKTIGLWLLGLTNLPLYCSAQQRPRVVTRLRIAETEMLSGKDYTITDSTISVKTWGLIDSVEYARNITMAERNKILKPLDRKLLFSWKKDYQGLTADSDGTSFDFTIVKGSSVKRVCVYKARVPILVEVCRQINTLLPKEVWIYYPTDITTY